MRWCCNKKSHAYMKKRQKENLLRSKFNYNENWMASILKRTGLKWKRQAQWGYRLFDFWCRELGIAVEVDGPEHDEQYDSFRDKWVFKKSGIVVIRVKNQCQEDAEFALRRISESESWNERRTKMKLKLIGITAE